MRIKECIHRYQVKLISCTVYLGGVVRIPITSVQFRIPASFLAQFNTHAALCKSAESARAIPLRTFREKVLADPYFPTSWGKNQRGMMAESHLDKEAQEKAVIMSRAALYGAVRHHENMEELGIHKQDANRLLEPWAWKNVIATATDWENFFALRCAEDAQPTMQELSWAIAGVVLTASPKYDSLHLPYVLDEERAEYKNQPHQLFMLSAARCARVSYAQHDTGKVDVDKDFDLAQKLIKSGHASPFEHPAMAVDDVRVDKYRGWRSARRDLSPSCMTRSVDTDAMIKIIESNDDLGDVDMESIKK